MRTPMSDTQHVQSSLVSIRSSDKIEDAFRKMKVNETGVEELNPYPDRPGERDCQFYLRTGLCGYGSSCRYNHPTHLPQDVAYYKEELPERIGQPDCEVQFLVSLTISNLGCCLDEYIVNS
uniref:Zinc finger protein 2 n=1 Tax=Arabidopsis thaliana TaxID=3702 RepID=Q570S8_ARATH|nr:zinc finger protein 2 [Arabidopsis thaliana]